MATDRPAVDPTDDPDAPGRARPETQPGASGGATPARDVAAPADAEPPTMQDLRDLRDEVHVLAADLPGLEDDVTTLLEPRDPSASDGDAGQDVSDVEVDPDAEVPRREHHVTAVLVAHDGGRWLPATLTALSRSTRRPDRVVAVDTGSTDTTPQVLQRAERAGLVDRILTLPRETGFGAAAAAALATGSGAGDLPGDVVPWVWLLHDDSAPAADALDALLLTADVERTADVLGPKVRGWRNQARLLEAGVTVARSGTRVTGLERRELDQGQHDGVRDTLAVSSAGMLVTRATWDSVHGFDPALPLFRDDVDFCWRVRRAGGRVVVTTDAVVHHREAATRGRRPVDAGRPAHPERARRLDRAAAIHLMRAHATGLGRVLVTARLLLGSVLRAVALLLGKAPEEARDEWGAFSDAVRDRAGLHASRERVAAAGLVPGAVGDAEVRHLLSPRRTQARHAWEYVVDTVAGRDTGDVQRSSLDSTPDDPDGWYADDRRPSRVRRLLTRPGTVLVLLLLLAALAGVRSLLGTGVLLGGALQPAPEGAGDLWAAYLQAWHEVGAGSPADAPAWLLPLTALAALLRGSASVAVDVVLLLPVPLAGLVAYLALGGVTRTTWVRVWAAATYATLPAVTGAMSGGRLGSAASIVLLPWLLRSGARVAGLGRPASWRRAFGTALLLAVVASFTPVVWLMAVVLAVLAGVFVVRDGVGRLRLAVTLLVPVVLLVPWSLRLVREPALLWLEPGLSGPTDPLLTPLDVVLLRPGGPSSTPVWLGVGIVLAALAGLGVRGGRRPVVLAWSVGLVGLAFALAEVPMRVSPSALARPVAPWGGVPVSLWAAGLLIAVVTSTDRLPRRLAGADFGWRQPATAALAVLLVLAPVGGVVLLVAGIDGPLVRGTREVVPAFVGAQMRSEERPRAIVLRRLTGGALSYDLLSAPEPQTGDVDVAPPQSVYSELDLLVARLAAGVGADEVDGLATHGIRFVVLADARRTDPLVDTLDGQRGLRRLSSQQGDTLWEITSVASRVQALTPSGDTTPGSVPVRRSTVVPTQGGDPRTPTAVSTTVPAGSPGRLLVMAETQDDRWRWLLDGQSVVAAPGTVAGSSDATDPALSQVPLSEAATPLEVSFDGSSRSRWLWVQLVAGLAVLVLALPSRRRDDDDADADSDEIGVDPDRATTAAAGDGASETVPDAVPDAATTGPGTAPADLPVEEVRA